MTHKTKGEAGGVEAMANEQIDILCRKRVAALKAENAALREALEKIASHCVSSPELEQEARVLAGDYYEIRLIARKAVYAAARRALKGEK